MTGPIEPPPSPDDIPEAVLRELRSVFGDPEDGPVATSDEVDGDSAALGTGAAAIASSDGKEPSRRARRRAERAAAKQAKEDAKRAKADAKEAAKNAEAAEKQRAADAKEAEKRAKKARRKGLPDPPPIAEAGDGSGDVRLVPMHPSEPGESSSPGASPGRGPGGAASHGPAAADGAERQPAARTIVIGGDDDLPDALYLDDVAEERMRDVHGSPGGERSGSSTIVIGDELDSSGAFDAVEVPIRSMDPRVRARRIAVKRAAGRRRLVWVGAAVLVIVLVVGALAVFSSTLFAVEDVEVQGATYTEFYDAPALQAVIDEMMGEPILLVDTLAAERQLEEIAWIERAIVTTDFPHSVMIDVRERQPLAAFQGSTDGLYRVIDREGRVLDVLEGRPADYMLITGQAPDTERGALAGRPWAEAAQLVAALPAEIRDITTAASVDATTRDLGLVLQPAIEVRLGGFAGLDAKLARLLQEVRDGLLGIVRIDVSTPEVSVTRG